MLDEPILITVGDQNFKCEGLTQVVQDEFQKWCENQDLQLIQQARGELGQRLYLDMVRDHLIKCRNNEFQFGSSDSLRHLQTELGYGALFTICMNKHQMVDPAMVHQMIKENKDVFEVAFDKLVASKKN